MKYGLLIVSLVLWPIVLPAQQTEQIDEQKAAELRTRQRQGQELSPEELEYIRRAMEYREKVQQLQSRQRQGEALSKEEAAFLRRALEARRKRTQLARANYVKANPVRESIGLVPLSELTDTYKGHEGGLYPGGMNAPPESHLEAGLKLAGKVVPLDGEGNPSPNGKIVLLSVGLSNTTQEYSAFMKLAEKAEGLNPKLVLVDGAQGGQSADRTADPNANYWRVSDRRIKAAGVTPDQVQVAWIKQATPGPRQPFPKEAVALQNHMVPNLHILMKKYPNLKIAYLSSRIYAGYAASGLNPEPHAYETAFSMKWLIGDQLSGNPELNYDPMKGPVRSPWLAWGPYLWADGLAARNDGLTFSRDDLGDDGTHPSEKGKVKVANLLMDFLKSDQTATPWFLEEAIDEANISH